MLKPYCSITAMITPFKPSLEIDFEALERLLRFQIDAGSDGLICFGTTGEGELLSDDEKIALLDCFVRVTQSGIPVFASVGSASTAHSVFLAKEAKKRGASGLLCTPPHFVRATDLGTILHFKKLLEVGLPLIVYHTPYRTGVTLSFETLFEILSLEGVLGVKECSGNFDLIKKLSLTFQDKIVFSGNDLSLMQELECGVRGSIAAIGNAIPSLWKKILSSQRKDIYAALFPLMQAVYKEVNPQGIKHLLAQMGAISNKLRLPLLPASKEAGFAIEEALGLDGELSLALYDLIRLKKENLSSLCR